MRNLPDYLALFAELEVDSFAEGCRWVSRLPSIEGVPPIEKWAIPSHGRLRASGLVERLDQLEGGASVPDPPTMYLEMRDGGVAGLQAIDDRWVLTFSLSTSELDAEGTLRAMAICVDVLRTLASAGATRFGCASWRGPGAAKCLPSVPGIGDRAFVAVTSVEEVNASYTDPHAFWAAWDEVDDVDGARLVTRALDCRSGKSFLERVIDAQWSLARASRPGGVTLGLPLPSAEERDVYRRGPRALSVVGYDQAAALLELACVLEPDQHIQGWEIFDLWHPLATGTMADGRELREVRVVFLDSDTAEREKQPLLAAGARVFVAGAEGDVEIPNR